MLDRRAFLQSAIGSGLALAAPALLADEPRKTDARINDTLRDIASRLQKIDVIERVEHHLVDEPETGLVQWRWLHFRDDLPLQEFDALEQVNGELLTAMESIAREKSNALDELLLEGLFEGKEEKQMEYADKLRKEMMAWQIGKPHPSGAPYLRATPSDEELAKAIHADEYVRGKMGQTVDTANGTMRVFSMSPLARLGAGYVLSVRQGVALRAAEDPVLDANAAAAERSGDPQEYKRCVFTERDRHFLECALGCRRKIVHFLVGAAHDLRDDIAASKTNVSHLVVTVKGVAKAENLYSQK